MHGVAGELPDREVPDTIIYVPPSWKCNGDLAAPAVARGEAVARTEAVARGEADEDARR